MNNPQQYLDAVTKELIRRQRMACLYCANYAPAIVEKFGNSFQTPAFNFDSNGSWYHMIIGGVDKNFKGGYKSFACNADTWNHLLELAGYDLMTFEEAVSMAGDKQDD